jgi:3D (Asp-Asp-Asp) domain-containing protein
VIALLLGLSFWGLSPDLRVLADPLPEPAIPALPHAAAPLLGRPQTVESALAALHGRRLSPDPDDDSKAAERPYEKLDLRTKFKGCCGYPLGERGTFKMTFYWLAFESDYANEPARVDIYTRHGFVIGRFPQTFVFEFKLEGSAVLRDGRVLNYDGRCPYGIGFCFQTLDPVEHPMGKGGQGRALSPYRSVAVDPRFVPLGTPLYLPELAGMILPDGSRHDGCVRADDTGGNIRRRELDFFVESYANYKFLDDQLAGDNHVTPYVEEARCAYLRTSDPSLDRRSEETDWARLHERKAAPGKAKPASKAKPHKKVAKLPSRPSTILTRNKGASLSRRPAQVLGTRDKKQRAGLNRRS